MGVKTIQTIKNSFRQEQISSGNEIYLFCLCYNSRRRFPDNLSPDVRKLTAWSRKLTITKSSMTLIIE